MNSQKRGYHYPIGQLAINKQHIWMKQYTICLTTKPHANQLSYLSLWKPFSK